MVGHSQAQARAGRPAAHPRLGGRAKTQDVPVYLRGIGTVQALNASRSIPRSAAC